MATDDKRSRPAKPDLLAEVEEDDWFSAIEEWDTALRLPESQAGQQAAATPGAAAATTPAEVQDPVADLTTGEKEVEPEDGGLALGDLLSNAPDDEPAPASVGAARPVIAADIVTPGPPAEVAVPPPAVDVPIPESVVALPEFEEEIETPAEEQDAQPAAAPPATAAPPLAAAFEELVAAAPPTRKAMPTGESVGAGFDALLGTAPLPAGVVPEGEPAAAAAPPEAEAAVAQEALELVSAPPPVAAPPAGKSKARLAAIDAGVADTADEPQVEAVDGGEVLPAAIARPIEPSGPGLLADLDAEQPPSAPAFPARDAPAHLSAVDLTALQPPEQCAPVEQSAADLELFGEAANLQANLVDNTRHAADLQWMAARAAEALGNVEDAAAQYQEVLSHRPGHLPAQLALWRLAASRKQSSQLAEVIRDLAAELPPAQGAALLPVAADLLWSRGGDDLGAGALLEGGRDGLNEPSVRHQLVEHDLALLANDADAERDGLAALAGAMASSPLGAVLRLWRGRALERGGQLEDAIAEYQRAVTADPRLLPAWEALIRCGEQREDYALVARALSQGAPLLGDWEAARRRRLAAIARWRDVEGVAAADELEAAALRAASQPLVLSAWADALRDTGGAAAEAYRQLADACATPEERAQALVESGLAAEALGARDEALAAFVQAAAIAPENPSAGDGIARLQLADEDTGRRLEALRAAANASSGPLRAVRHLEAAELLEGTGAAEEAASELVRALEHDPACAVALTRLEQLYRASGQLAPLAAILDTAAEVSDDPERAADLRLRAADVYAGGLGQLEPTLTRLRAVLATNAERRDVHWALQRTLAALGRYEELAQELEAEAEGASGEPAAALWTACGMLLAATAPAAAEERFRRAQAAVPDYAPAAWALAGSAAGRNDWHQVIDIWSALASALPDESLQRKALFLRVGAAQQLQLGNADAAAGAFAAAAAEPNPLPGARHLLQRASRELQLGGDAAPASPSAEQLERELGASGDAAARFAVLLAAADVTRRGGLSRDEAAALYARALQEVPAHPMARRALEDLHCEDGAWHPLSDLLVADLKDAASDAERVLLYDRIAEIDLTRGDRAGADLAFASMLELDREHVEALRQRQSALQRDAVWHDLATNLARQAQRAKFPADAAALWLEAARLSLARDPGDAVAGIDGSGEGPAGMAEAPEHADDAARRRGGPLAAFRAALQQAPESLLALLQLTDLATSRDDQPLLVETLHALAQRCELAEERAALATQAAELRGGSATDYAAVLDLAPGYLGAIYRLRDVALLTDDWEHALRAAEAEAATSNVDDHVARAAMLAAALAKHKLSADDRAAAQCRRALEVAPFDRWPFELLRQLLAEQGAWPELATLLSTRLELEPDTSAQVALHRQLAAISLQHLADPAAAMEHLHAVLEVDAENTAALGTLAEIHESAGEWVEAADSLIRWARLEQDHHVLRELFMRLGLIFQDHAKDAARAIASFRKVVSLDPENAEALSRLSDLYLEELDFDKALSVTSQLLEVESDPQEQVEHLLRIAKICEDGLKDAHQAASAFRRALEIGADDLRAIGALCGFYARQGDQRSMMVHLDRSVAAMRSRLRKNPFDGFAYHALFKIFGWRKAPDACYCAAEILQTFEQTDDEERAFLTQRASSLGAAGANLGRPEHDDWIFQRGIPGGFRQIFQLLGDAFAKIRQGDLQSLGVGRGDRLDSGHPFSRAAEAAGRDLGVGNFRVFLARQRPDVLAVENTDPPSIVVGPGILQDASDAELQFFAARSLWIVAKSMILPTRFKPEDLELLVSAVVRQYVAEFSPADVDADALKVMTKQVGRVIPRRLKQELMPFALECSGPSIDLRSLGAAVIHSANRAALLACRSVDGAVAALRKISGVLQPPRTRVQGVEQIQDNPEVQEMLRFAVSDEHFELRRALGISVR